MTGACDTKGLHPTGRSPSNRGVESHFVGLFPIGAETLFSRRVRYSRETGKRVTIKTIFEIAMCKSL